MFLDELQPVVKELLQQPLAFLGGFVSGMLHLKITDEPLKEWLEKQGITTLPSENKTSSNGNSPQSIDID